MRSVIEDIEKKMRLAASNLEFEDAARLRDEIQRLEVLELEMAPDALFATDEEARSKKDRLPETALKGREIVTRRKQENQ